MFPFCFGNEARIQLNFTVMAGRRVPGMRVPVRTWVPGVGCRELGAESLGRSELPLPYQFRCLLALSPISTPKSTTPIHFTPTFVNTTLLTRWQWPSEVNNNSKKWFKLRQQRHAAPLPFLRPRGINDTNAFQHAETRQLPSIDLLRPVVRRGRCCIRGMRGVQTWDRLWKQ